MIRQVLFVYLLSFFIVLSCTRSGVTSTIIKCKNDADCNNGSQSCHSFFKVCVKKKRLPAPFGKTSRQSSCKCLVNEYCHPVFDRCLPTLALPATRNNRKPTTPDCKQDSDCTSGKYCHQRFKKCLNVLAIPTFSSTKSATVSCKNDSNCTSQQYCHDFFKICLVKPTMVLNTTTSQARFVCSSDADCKAGHYCHNMTHICLQMRNISRSRSRTASLPKNKDCKTNSDCQISEFCNRIFGQSTTAKAARHRRKCSGGSHCSPNISHRKGTGACVPKMVVFDPPFNCTRNEDCGHGMCCLKKLGICRNLVKKSGACIVKAADFVCPCSKKLFCKANLKGKKLRGRRLERKLKIPKHVRQALISKGLLYHKKYLYGRCQRISN